jgi:hypothetical protein
MTAMPPCAISTKSPGGVGSDGPIGQPLRDGMARADCGRFAACTVNGKKGRDDNFSKSFPPSTKNRLASIPLFIFARHPAGQRLFNEVEQYGFLKFFENPTKLWK